MALAPGFLALSAVPASAHPLGNFTVNTYSGLVVRTDGIELRFVLDMAEIPTFQAKSQRVDTDDDGRTGEAELDAFGRSECQRLRDGVDLRRDDREVPLSVGTVALSFPPGQAGLSTLRLICVMAEALVASVGTLISKGTNRRNGPVAARASRSRRVLSELSEPSSTSVSAPLQRAISASWATRMARSRRVG